MSILTKYVVKNCTSLDSDGTTCQDCSYYKDVVKNEIIIDGVDVAGCEHHLSTGYCQLQMIFQGMVLKLPFGKHLECNLCDKDCYYKQLKRLEQENEKLKKEVKQIGSDFIKKGDYARELEQENKVNLSRAKDLNTELQRLTDENFNLKQTLEEIREKAQHCIRQDVCALCDYSEECAVPDADGLVYDNNRLLIKLINDVLNP